MAGSGEYGSVTDVKGQRNLIGTLLGLRALNILIYSVATRDPSCFSVVALLSRDDRRNTAGRRPPWRMRINLEATLG